jgi:DNA repair exonuclease SbcCD ATPase subunit
MDLDQIVKRLEWIDSERRKDKTTIATLEERLVTLEGNIPGLAQQVRDLSGDISRISAQLARFDQIETTVAQMRVDLSRAIDAVEKARLDHDREMDKVRQGDLENINRLIGEVRKGLDPIPEIRKTLQARIEEEYRLGRLIEEAEKKIGDTNRYDEEYRRSLRLLDEGRRQDTKRLTDVQGELAALRKRQEEQRGKVDLSTDTIRKVEMRLSDLQASEAERRQSVTAFVEKQALFNVERERVWKDWQVRFETIEKQAINLDSQLQSLDATNRAVKRSQEAFDDITQKFERRINEVTEMQRLTEDRFRQEWVGFRADDQKRWTNYNLMGEEQQREYGKSFEKLQERMVFFEDLSQEMQDMVQQINTETQKRLQALLSLSHDWMDAYEKTFGRVR